MCLYLPHLKLYNLEEGKFFWRNQLGACQLWSGYKPQRSLGFLELLFLLRSFTNTWNMLILLINGKGLEKYFKMMKILNVNIDGPISRSKNVCSIQLSRSVVSHSLWPHESQHTRPPCPSPTPGVHPNSCPLSRWCRPAISSSVVPFSSCPQSLPAWVFSNESTLHMRWPKYWSFSFSIIPSKEHSGLNSFRMDWLDLLAVQGTLKSLLQHHSSKASIL